MEPQQWAAMIARIGTHLSMGQCTLLLSHLEIQHPSLLQTILRAVVTAQPTLEQDLKDHEVFLQTLHEDIWVASRKRTTFWKELEKLDEKKNICLEDRNRTKRKYTTHNHPSFRYLSSNTV